MQIEFITVLLDTSQIYRSNKKKINLSPHMKKNSPIFQDIYIFLTTHTRQCEVNIDKVEKNYKITTLKRL